MCGYGRMAVISNIIKPASRRGGILADLMEVIENRRSIRHYQGKTQQSCQQGPFLCKAEERYEVTRKTRIMHEKKSRLKNNENPICQKPHTSLYPGFCEIPAFDVDSSSRTDISCGFTPLKSCRKSKNRGQFMVILLHNVPICKEGVPVY